MLCQFERLIYPHDISMAENGQYMVAVYNPCENVKDSTGNSVTQIKAVGYCLPTADNIRYDIQGHWSKNSKHGIQFEVENYEEVITHTKEGIIGYLSSGQIKGIGPKVAEKIYNVFGNHSLDVLDKEPEKLLQVLGISQNKLKKIYNSYLANRGARDIIAFLMPHGITANKAIKFYQHYKEKTMNIVRNHPYQLCEISGIGFIEADKIAMSFGLSKTSTERADQALIYTLMNAEKDGHICMEKHKFISECQKLLNTPELTEQMLANRASKLVYTGKLVSYAGFVYRSEMAKTESDLAYQIIKRKQKAKVPSYTHIDKDIAETEKKFNVTFAAEQREAIKAALTNGVSIITGGPGTGKTMIQKAIIEIYRKNNSDKDIKCCAPTGRAARRMTESTGFDASTIHKALNLFADDSGNYSEPELLDADFVIVDEVSMLDIHIAGMLFDALKHNCQIVLIGDSEQLPSVGPGAVLSEMIESKCVPTVRLDTVFRQNSGSRIAVNARLIRHGDHELEYGDDFEFINSPNLEESAKLMVDTYVKETSKYGIDNVALLTPFRKKTVTGVNSVNEAVREIINPGTSGITFRNQSYRHGDKVMQIKNHEDVNNGDVGYITDISKGGSDTTVSIDFGGGKIKEYDINDLEQIDLGYANYKDPVDCYLSEASASRTYSEENPSVSPREWAQTAAIGIALRNAGFGLQFQIAGEVFDSITPNEFEQTPAKQSDTQNDLASTESTGPDTDSSQNPESEYTTEEYTAELTDEEKLEKAYQTLCPITKYSGKTLAEVLTVDPHALVWVANKYKGNPEISEAAKLICEHALSENNE